MEAKSQNLFKTAYPFQNVRKKFQLYSILRTYVQILFLFCLDAESNSYLVTSGPAFKLSPGQLMQGQMPQ